MLPEAALFRLSTTARAGAGAVCLFGTWVGMRHFARARATSGTTRPAGCSWPRSAPARRSGRRPSFPFWRWILRSPARSSRCPALSCWHRRRDLPCRLRDRQPAFTLAPELGGVVIGAGVLAMHLIGLKAWHTEGTTQGNAYGVATTFVLGLGLGALAVNRANRPVTRWCRHGAAIVLAFMICAMHYALTPSDGDPDPSVALPPYLIPADVLGFAVVGAVLLVMGAAFRPTSSTCARARNWPTGSISCRSATP